MIEELKQLLDVMKELPELAIWSVLGFGIYKLVVYLSTTGSIVFILKLAIEKLHDMKTRDPKPVTHVYSLKSITFMGEAEEALTESLIKAINRVSNKETKSYLRTYIHTSDIEPILKALNSITREENK
jgi:hypothetical protein